MAFVTTVTLSTSISGSGDAGPLGPRNFNATVSGEAEYLDTGLVVAEADVDRVVSISEVATPQFVVISSDADITFKINGGAEVRKLRANVAHVEATDINTIEFTGTAGSGGTGVANVSIFAVGS